MSELLDYYSAQAKNTLSPVTWLAALQQKALSDLSQQGFPSRSDEDWKYTAVESLLEQRFSYQAPQNAKVSIPHDLPFSQRIEIINGVIHGLEALQSTLPEGVIILPLQDAVEKQAEKIKPYLEQCVLHTHGFQALNTAMLQTGLFIYIPAGICLDETLVLSHWQDQDKQAVYQRHIIVAEARSQATFIENYQGAEQPSYFTNSMTDIFLHPEAEITHCKLLREGKAAYHIGQISVRQDRNSHFESHSLSLGGKLIRSDLDIQLLQEGAHCLMNGLYLPTEGQHIDHHTRVDHCVPNCSSHQDYKGILSARSRAVFNGKVIVAKDAQHSEARQQNKNLLLADGAEINTKPQLEIFADDVICTHGATVGQLDEDALFYLATRGIDRKQATNFLVHAFTVENMALIKDKALAAWINTLLNDNLNTTLGIK